MFIVFLRFSDNRHQASKFLEGHNAWLKREFDTGTFLLAGSLQPDAGGSILAQRLIGRSLKHCLMNNRLYPKRRRSLAKSRSFVRSATSGGRHDR